MYVWVIFLVVRVFVVLMLVSMIMDVMVEGVMVESMLFLFFVEVFKDRVGCLELGIFFEILSEVDLLIFWEELVNVLFKVVICMVFIVCVIFMYFCFIREIDNSNFGDFLNVGILKIYFEY